jgi:hypothetical protein
MEGSELLPIITWYEQEIESLQAQIQNLQANNSALVSQAVLTKVQDVVDFEIIRERILFELKLVRQVSGYKITQLTLNRLIAEL